MKDCRRACIVQFVTWVAVAPSFYLYARAIGGENPDAIAASAAIGLLTTMALLVAASTIQTAREWRTLTHATSRTPLRDGAWSAVIGELRTAAPVRAPITGELVAVYEYSIGRDQHVGRGTSLVTYFSGKSLAASSIGTVRLLSVPILEVSPAQSEESRAIANAREYVRRASFVKRDTPRERTSALEREWTDDDGVFRIDRKYSASDVDLDGSFRFEERHLKPHEIVCAFGVYSSARGGLVPDERWGRPTRIMRGDGNEISQQLRRRTITYALISLALGAIAGVSAIAYLRHIAAG